MRAVSLHRDVIVVTSAVLHLNCVIVRGDIGDGGDGGGRSGELHGAAGARPAETFLIDSPVLPEELDTLPALIEQAGFPSPSGLLVTHGDWDHLLGRLAFPGVALGACESTVARLNARPGDAQRALRAFDEELMIDRPRPLSLGAPQPLPVPGRCDLGDQELHLHPAEGHTADGMAIVVPAAGLLIAGDYLSAVEIPTLDHSGDIDGYLATLELLRRLLGEVHHVVPGHGPVLTAGDAATLLDEDVSYISSLRERPHEAELPAGRRSRRQRELHAANLAAI
jgi:glyoxylase-like metal-dependent hydrolase (beta-lactamase superfamily II)